MNQIHIYVGGRHFKDVGSFREAIGCISWRIILERVCVEMAKGILFV